MGLFLPPKSFRERTFTMPCSAREALEVIADATDSDGDKPFGHLLATYSNAREQRGESAGQPPLVETVYIESLKDDGDNIQMTIAAGNRVKTMWRLRLELSGDNPVNGSFGGIDGKPDRWFKNIWNCNLALGHAVRSVGGKTMKWPAEIG